MKRNMLFLSLIFITFSSCKNQVECCDLPSEEVQVNLNFTHNWDGETITNADFNELKFQNENGETLSIERLRYLISNIRLTNQTGTIFSFDDYNLVDVTNEENLSLIISEQIPTGKYTSVTFTFGLTDEDNTDGIYADLNTANFNVPGMLGGGYHYMQFDGKFINSNEEETGFNYHAIRAVNNSDTENLQFEDTSFDVDLGEITIENNATITIEANISEWFKNPNTWNLNELNTFLMPNFDAQKLMNQNGKSVFSLGEIIQ